MLQDAMAATRGDQASVEAALAQDALAAKADAQKTWAVQANDYRAQAAQQEQDQALQLLQMQAQANIDKANRLAQLSPADYDAMQGTVMTASDIPNELTTFDTSRLTPATETPGSFLVPGATGGLASQYDLNNVISGIATAYQDPQSRNPGTALRYWGDYYANLQQKYPAAIAIMAAAGYPTSALEMVNWLGVA
jgi:hypothetical protein